MTSIETQKCDDSIRPSGNNKIKILDIILGINERKISEKKKKYNKKTSEIFL